MKKIMKKALSLMLALVMVFSLAPMTAKAASPIGNNLAGDGTYEAPYQLSETSGRWGFYLEAQEGVYVKVDDANDSTVAVSYATGSNYFVQYGPRNQYTATEGDENNATSFQMNSEMDYFYVANNSETDGVTIYMTLTAGEGSSVPAGTYDNPEEVSLQNGMWGISGEATVALEADNEGYFYKVTAPADGAIEVYVNAYDAATYAQVGYMYNVDNTTQGTYGEYRYSDEEETPVELVEVEAGDVLKIRVTTYNPDNFFDVPAGTIRVQVSFYEPGSQAYPEVVETGDHTANIVANSWGYYYSYTASSNGKVTVALDENSTNWTYVVNNVTAYGYGDNHYSDDDTPQFNETVSVNAGDEIQIIFGTLDYAAGTIDWTLSFEADTTGGDLPPAEDDTTGTIDNPEDLVLGTNADEITEGNFMYYYTWTAPGKGTFTVYGDELQSPDGYGYVVMVNDENVGSGSSANTTEDYQDKTAILVEKDQVVEVRVYRPDFSSGKFAIRAEFANYKISDTILGVKENAVTLDQNHEYTIFAFEVAEDGNYTISTTGTTIGNWGSFDWNLNNPNATTNTMTVNLEKDQTFYYGVPSDKAECTITIVRNGDIEDDGPTYTPYTNKVTPEAYTFGSTEENLIYINVKDNVEDTIVLGKDGFYHYGTENGPVVLVDLANETLSFAAMVGSGIGEDVGTTPARDPYTMVDYTSAIQAYVANSDKETKLYPLTEDLITFFKVYGESQGWYGTKLGFNLFGDNAVDPEKYWMFACCYVYEVVEGDNATWTQGSADGLTLKANGNFAEFIGLKVDGVEVDKANYTAKEGSTIVTLSKDYLATLAVGDHTVTFVYENNGFEYTADATITIATPVKAGDSTNIALWIAVLGLGVVAIAGSVVMRKREF